MMTDKQNVPPRAYKVVHIYTKSQYLDLKHETIDQDMVLK